MEITSEVKIEIFFKILIQIVHLAFSATAALINVLNISAFVKQWLTRC